MQSDGKIIYKHVIGKLHSIDQEHKLCDNGEKLNLECLLIDKI